jgi:hypothetical protein
VKEMPSWATILIAAGLAALPTFISALPPDYAAAASATIAALASVYHLYQPVPGAGEPKK